jgi:hypothetical protein
MLRAESEWVLACLEVDPDDIAFLNSDSTNNTTKDASSTATAESTAKDNDLESQRLIPQPLPPLSTKKGLDCSEDLSEMFQAYGSWMTSRHDNLTAADGIQVGHMKRAQDTSKRLQNIGMPDMDICVLLSLLVEETKHNTDLADSKSDTGMMNTTAEKVTIAVKMWRLVAYCKLMAMVYCSHDKLIVADLSKTERSQNSVNVFEFDGIEDVLAKHDLKCTQWKMDSETGELNIQQMSPFDAVGNFIRRLTCIAEVPFSYLQGMSFLSTNGGFMCDPWVLEPSLSTDSPSFYAALALQLTEYIKLFLLQGYLRRAQSNHLLKNYIPSHVLSPQFVPGTLDRLHTLCKGNNLNHMRVPIEILRDYCARSVLSKKVAKKGPKAPAKSSRNRVTMTTKNVLHTQNKTEVEYTNAQITLRFWSAYRREGIAQTSFYQYAMEKRLHHNQKGRDSKTNRNNNEGKRNFVNGGKREGSGLRGSSGLRGEDSQANLDLVQTVMAASETQQQSKHETTAAARVEKIKDNSVFDLLSLELSCAGFTDIIDSAVSDEQDTQGVPTAFVDTIGVLMNPLNDVDKRGTVQVALEYEAKLHHPLQKSVCLWAFAHHQPYTLTEVEQLINKQLIPFHVEEGGDKRGNGTLSKHYPTHYELRRRIEMSMLLQYSVSVSVSVD